MRTQITNKLLTLMLLATACGGRQTEGTDGNTHWLQCEDDNDCTNYPCIDGYCRPESAGNYTSSEPGGTSPTADDVTSPSDHDADVADEGFEPLRYASDVPGALGAACIPSDEYSPEFRGFSYKQISLAPNNQCDSNLCLVNKFQGRVTCPFGQISNGDGECLTADGASTVEPEVSPQLAERRPENSVYCSCRCDGPDPDAEYCACGEGFECAELVPASVPGQEDKVGSYCVVAGSNPNPEAIKVPPCDADSCGTSDHYTPNALGVSPLVPAPTERTTVTYELVLWYPPVDAEYNCLPLPLPVTTNENGVTVSECRVFEALEGSSQSCDAPGRSAVSAHEVAAVQEWVLEGKFFCQGADCSADVTVCELVQLVEGPEGVSSCLNDEAATGDGWCYIDADQGAGNDELVVECPATALRRVRGVGSALESASLKFLYCLGSP